MKNFLQNLLIFLALCLCGLIAFQWVRETALRQQRQKLTDTLHEKLEAIQKLEADVRLYKAEIQRLDATNNLLNAEVQSNRLEISTLTNNLQKVTAETENNQKQIVIYKDALKQANDNIEFEKEQLRKQGEELQRLAASHNLLVSNLSLTSKTISELANKWSAMNDSLQRATPAAQREMAVTNRNAMASDFNGFVSNWNAMLQTLQRSSTNAPASN